MMMPMGMPKMMAMIVATTVMAMVFIVSSHMSKYPMRRRVRTTPMVIFQLRLASQAISAKARMISGHGDVVSSCSTRNMKYCTG